MYRERQREREKERERERRTGMCFAYCALFGVLCLLCFACLVCHACCALLAVSFLLCFACLACFAALLVCSLACWLACWVACWLACCAPYASVKHPSCIRVHPYESILLCHSSLRQYPSHAFQENVEKQNYVLISKWELRSVARTSSESNPAQQIAPKCPTSKNMISVPKSIT